MPTRVITPELAFQASLKIAQRAAAVGKATITRGEAERALQELASLDPAASAHVVAAYLDGHDAASLSPRARDVLVAFVKKAGGSAVDVHAQQREHHRGAGLIDKARARLHALLGRALPKDGAGGAHHEVTAWLDQAKLDVADAKDRLHTLADASAQAARHVGDFAHDVQRLWSAALRITRHDLAELRHWLSEPLPHHSKTAHAAHAAHASHPWDRLTVKYPSDVEDSGDAGHMTTQKYPSDNEDGGGTPLVSHRKISAQHAGAIRRVYAKVASTLAWHSGALIEKHAHERFAKVDVERKDGDAVVAYVPLGALTPTAADVDPNRVDSVYFERTRGKNVEHAGPVRL